MTYDDPAVEAQLQAIASDLLAWLDRGFSGETKQLLPSGMFATLSKHDDTWMLSLFNAIRKPTAADVAMHAKAFGAPGSVKGHYTEDGYRVTMQWEVRP